MTPAGLIQLQKDEGCRLTAYPDPVSKGDPWTIGYGQTGPDIGPGTVWTQAQADAALAASVASVEQRLETALPWFANLDPVRQDVLVNIAYNIGVHGLLEWPHTLGLFEAGNYSGAADALLQEGTWDAEVGQRADRLSAVTRSGVWPS